MKPWYNIYQTDYIEANDILHSKHIYFCDWISIWKGTEKTLILTHPVSKQHRLVNAIVRISFTAVWHYTSWQLYTWNFSQLVPSRCHSSWEKINRVSCDRLVLSVAWYFTTQPSADHWDLIWEGSVAILRVQEQRDTQKDKGIHKNLEAPAANDLQDPESCPLREVHCPPLWRKWDAAAKQTGDISLYKERTEEVLKAAEFKQCS